MNITVIKRDGSRAAYKNSRIIDAIKSASEQVTPEIESYAQLVAHAVEVALQDKKEVGIRQIQDLVENELMQGPHKVLARAYIEYRHDRDIAREKISVLNKEISGLIEQDRKSVV